MKRVHDLLGLPPEYHEDGPPEYTTPPDEYNRFAPTEPPAKAGKSRMVKMLLLAVAGLSLLGVALPGLSLVPPAEPEPTPAAVSPTPAPAVAVVPEERYTVQAWHEPPSGARVTLTWEGVGESADGATGLSVPEGARVRLSYVPEVPYTMEDVSLGGVMLDGAITQTDDPLLFTVGKGGGVIHFYLNYPSDGAPTPTPEPTPEPTPAPTSEPTPGVTITYYRRSAVYEAFAYWTMPEQMESVTVRLTDPYMGTIFEHELTAEEVAFGYYELNHFDLYNYLFTNGFSFDNLPSDYDPNPLLEVTYAYGENGPAGTETAEAAYEMWVNLSYDDPDDDMSWIWGSYYPDCFVVRIEDRLNYDGLKIYYGEQDKLSPGDVWVKVTVDGQDIPADTCRLVLEPYEEANGEVYYAYTFVMPRPDTFPEHGTAHLVLTQKLVHYDMTATRERDYTY